MGDGQPPEHGRRDLRTRAAGLRHGEFEFALGALGISALTSSAFRGMSGLPELLACLAGVMVMLTIRERRRSAKTWKRATAIALVTAALTSFVLIPGNPTGIVTPTQNADGADTTPSVPAPASSNPPASTALAGDPAAPPVVLGTAQTAEELDAQRVAVAAKLAEIQGQLQELQRLIAVAESGTDPSETATTLPG